MSAIYVLAGDERVGPFTIEEIREKVGQGIFTPENLGWQEGLETWVPVSSLIPDEEASEETQILHESRQCTLTTESLEFGGQVIPLDEMASVEVEAEHTKRSRPILGIIIFTLLLLVLLFSPLHLVASNALIVRIAGGVILGFLLIRSLLAALSPAQAIVAILLRDGGTRMLTLPHAEALVLIKAINEAVGTSNTIEEERDPS